MTTGHAGDRLAELAKSGTLDLAAPGHGLTSERHGRLAAVARHETVSVGRLAEAHCDAVAILFEAGHSPRPGVLYGVWASGGSSDTLLLDTTAATIGGTKPFCSGFGLLDRALVTATGPGGETYLIDVGLRDRPTVWGDSVGWSTDALAATNTGSVRFADHGISAEDLIGPAEWYLNRPGFWHGACGPAACWAGAALGLLDEAERLVDATADPHRFADLGSMRAAGWAMQAVLDAAGREIDAAPDDFEVARYRARAVRRTIERLCTDLLGQFSESFGPRPFTTNSAVAQRYADTHLYIRQHHGRRDDFALGCERRCQAGTS